MTSIVVSLYFKQENCETLISLYNWGWMKRCQSQLVSCKVEWFCSLAGFSWWPGLSLFLSVSVCLFPCSLLALCSSLFWRAEKRLYLRRPGGEGCIIRANNSRASACSVPSAFSSAVGAQAIRLHPPAGLTTSTYFHCRPTILSLHLLFVCLATVFVPICIQLNEKQVPSSLSCCINPSTNSKVSSAITRCLRAVMKTGSVVTLFVQDAKIWWEITSWWLTALTLFWDHVFSDIKRKVYESIVSVLFTIFTTMYLFPQKKFSTPEVKQQHKPHVLDILVKFMFI